MVSICCRLCLLNGSDLMPILDLTVNSNVSNEPVTLTLSQLIISYLSIEPVIEGITETYVCSECRNMIAKWHWFRESCLHNDGLYQKMAQDPGKDDDVRQIEEYYEVKVKQEQEEVEIDEKYKEDLFTEPLDAPPPKKKGCSKKVIAKKSSPAKNTGLQGIKKRGRPPLPESEKKSRAQMCTLCGKVVRQMDAHMRMHNQDRCFQCPHCPMNFYSQSSWKGHVNVHTKEIKYTCPVCDKFFWRKETLKMHLNSHLDEPKFKCPYCPKAYRMRSGLVVHRKSHTGAPNIQCEGCDKKFYTKDQMEKHAVRHLAVKPYECKICERGFTRKYYLAAHVEKAHPDSKEMEKKRVTTAGDSNREETLADSWI